MNKTITKAYIRHYRDNGQTVGIVEWSDGSRTEGPHDGTHMAALLERARRNGVFTEQEIWNDWVEI